MTCDFGGRRSRTSYSACESFALRNCPASAVAPQKYTFHNTQFPERLQTEEAANRLQRAVAAGDFRKAREALQSAKVALWCLNLWDSCRHCVDNMIARRLFAHMPKGHMMHNR